MTNKDRDEISNEEKFWKKKESDQANKALEELRKLLGQDAIFLGTVDQFLDDICGSVEENEDTEDKGNA